MNKHDSNNVSQNNNTVQNGDIAGRDINKNVYNQSGAIFNIHIQLPLDYVDLIQTLQKITGLPNDFIATVVQNGYDINTVKDSLAALNVSKNSKVLSFFGAGVDLVEEYETLLLSNSSSNHVNDNYFQGIIRAAASSIRKLDFQTAHKLFVSALAKMDSDHMVYGLLYKEYLITGFIHYSRRNDMNGLNKLLRKKRPLASLSDPTIDYIIANIFQEACSRGTDLADVEKAAKTLEKIYITSSVAKPLIANSLGLAFRRYGERTDIRYLQEAVKYFDEGLLHVANKTMEIELKDQKAITLIRIFEFNFNIQYLEQAEVLLSDCLTILATVNDPRDRKLKPRVLNNLGNIYKQRTLVFEDVTSASKALAYYSEANKIWTEKDYSYEWGLSKKNIGETKLALGKILNDSQIVKEAINSCLASMTHRDLKNSPYQWAKSAELLFAAVLLLQRMQQLCLIHSPIRRKIIRFAKQTITYPKGWEENNFKHFKGNAIKVLNLLDNSANL